MQLNECVGVPNTGKSALINALRHVAKVKREGGGGKADTGATPGLTRRISGFQVRSSCCALPCFA